MSQNKKVRKPQKTREVTGNEGWCSITANKSFIAEIDVSGEDNFKVEVKGVVLRHRKVGKTLMLQFVKIKNQKNVYKISKNKKGYAVEKN